MALVNRSPSVPFHGWVRTTSDAPWLRPGAAYTTGTGETIVVGRSLGGGIGYEVDVKLTLAGGESWNLSLPADDSDFIPTAVPPDWFGGQPAIGDVMQPVGLRLDGASFESEFWLQRGLFEVTMSLRWYPGEAWVYGEMSVKNAYGDGSETWEAPELKFGDGEAVPAAPIPKGTVVAPGQTRTAPVTFWWERHLSTTLDRNSLVVAVNRLISASGLPSPAGQVTPWFPVVDDDGA